MWLYALVVLALPQDVASYSVQHVGIWLERHGFGEYKNNFIGEF